MFHHFHDDIKHPNSNGGGSISANDFNLIIDFIEENYNLITPREFIYKVSNTSIRESDVCLTFDDGLKSQYEIIFPELQKRKLKAFFFIYSSAFSKSPPMLEFFRDFRLFFFNDLEDYYEMFFKSVRLNYHTEFNIFKKNYKTAYLSSYPFYSDNDRKYRFLRDVILKEKYFDIVLELMEQKDYSISGRKGNLFMSINDLKILHDNGHSLGLHSHNHSTSFNHLSYEKQLDEYSTNYDFITSITNEKINSMSHPLGNYNNDTLKILKKLDIKVGFRDSLVPSVIKSDLEIPREDHTNILKIIRSQ